jgi:hypothetical protein
MSENPSKAPGASRPARNQKTPAAARNVAYPIAILLITTIVTASGRAAQSWPSAGTELEQITSPTTLADRKARRAKENKINGYR